MKLERAIQQDLSQRIAFNRFPNDLDVVIHCAAVVGEGKGDPELYEEVNVRGTERLLECAKRSGVGHFVFFSTGGVYAPTAAPMSEVCRIGPVGTYAESKWRAEEICRDFADSSFRVTIVRAFFPYGPRQAFGLIPLLASKILSDDPISLFQIDDGPKTNPICVVDLVHAIELLLDFSENPLNVFNLAGPNVVTIRELGSAIAELLKKTVHFERLSNNAETNWIGQCEALERATGWKPTIGIRVGLREALG